MLKKSSNNTILVSLVFFGLTMIVLLWGVLVGTEDLNQWKGFLEDLSKRPFLRPPKINYKRLQKIAETILVSLVFFGLTMIVLLWGVLMETEDLHQWRGLFKNLRDLSKKAFLKATKDYL